MKKPKLNNQQIGALADAFGKSLQTIRRWVDKNDDRLTSDRAKTAIQKVKDNE